MIGVERRLIRAVDAYEDVVLRADDREMIGQVERSVFSSIRIERGRGKGFGPDVENVMERHRVHHVRHFMEPIVSAIANAQDQVHLRRRHDLRRAGSQKRIR